MAEHVKLQLAATDITPKRYFCALWTTGQVGLQPDSTNTQTKRLFQNFMIYFSF